LTTLVFMNFKRLYLSHFSTLDSNLVGGKTNKQLP